MMPSPLRKNFESRNDLEIYMQEITAESLGGHGMAKEDLKLSPTQATPETLAGLMAAIDPAGYAKSRNFLNGKITKLSPFIRHGMVSLNHVRNLALSRVTRKGDAEKLVQELGWRAFWRNVETQNPDWLWHDVEPYKTGYFAHDYADQLPQDIAEGETGVAAIDDIIDILKTDGYVHNHLRMYLASYIVHWRQVKWQAGAAFMLSHLIDADLASNNLSWQWIASTYSSKPYIFNLENMQKYCGDQINTISKHNIPLDAGYDVLSARLFPHKDMMPV